MALPRSQEIMPPDCDLSPADMREIDELNSDISRVQSAQLEVAQLKVAQLSSLLVQQAATLEAAAATLVESRAIDRARESLGWKAGAESLVWRVEAETARLQVEVEKVRKEVETAQAGAASKWAEHERLLGEGERLTKAALRGVREAARLRGERERGRRVGGKTMAGTEKAGEEEESSDYARMKQELRDTCLELMRMSHESVSNMFELSRPMAETGRLAIEAERLRAEVDQMHWMTVEDCQKAAKD